MPAIPIRQLATVASGGGAPQDSLAFSADGYPFVRAGSLVKLLEGIEQSALEKLRPDVAQAYGLRLFPAGAVLFAKSGMSATKGYVYRLTGPAYVVNHLAALIPHDLSDGPFLAHALRRFPPTSLIRDQAYPSIRLGDIEEMQIVAPASSHERQRIAAILDQTDALRRKRDLAIETLAKFERTIFIQMFGHPITNPNEYAIQPLRALGKVSTGKTPSTKQPEYFGGLIPFVTPGDLESNREVVRTLSDAGARSARTVRAGSTLVCCIGATIGKMDKAANDSAFNQQINAIEWGERVVDEYGLAIMRFFKVRVIALGTSTTLPILKKSAFEMLCIPVAPLERQRRFAAIVRKSEELRMRLRQESRRLNVLSRALQQDLFRCGGASQSSSVTDLSRFAAQ